MSSSWVLGYARILYLLKAAARYVRWLPTDLRQGSEGSGEPPMPPMRLSFVGRGDFERTGREYLGYFRDLGGLRPTDRVLDVGCGIGRMAIPLMGYLDGGSYAGFDVGRSMIRWCTRNITRRRPDFEFRWAPIFNRKYNPFGNVSAAEFRFPYEDSSFDFVFATSLFTHLLPDDAEHYLDEIARVLKPGGTCLLTFFLLTPEAEREVRAGNTQFAFDHEVDGAMTTDPRRPEEAVAFRLADGTAMFARASLEVTEPIHFGRWANNGDGVAGQDIVVAGSVG